MDNPEKLATLDTQNTGRKEITQNVLDISIPKKLDVKTNQTSFICENRSGYHNTES
jgi:hypothetical protein